MQRAQTWLQSELTRIGLANVAAEPFMDYGVTWDNEYASIHRLEPDYTTMIGYPIAHTAGTEGRVVADAVIVPTRPAPARAIPNPAVMTAVEKVAFYRSESVAVVMVGAHFDTWHASPHASDNTSGVAVALWAGEEQGLFGSRAYGRQHFGDPRDPTVGVKPAYEKLSAYFNQDYGAGQYRGIYLQGNESARSMLAAWMEPFRDLGMTTVSNQSVGSTDHIAFDEVGLPGFQFLQDRTPGTGGHTNVDFLEGIQAQDLITNATIMASYVYHAAIADERMPRKAAPR